MEKEKEKKFITIRLEFDGQDYWANHIAFSDESKVINWESLIQAFKYFWQSFLITAAQKWYKVK